MPKRAIFYLCWGEKYIAQAVNSARTAGILGVDRLLITTPESLPSLPPDAPFAQVIAHRFTLPGMLAKSEMVDLLPGEYDSFLFLDADTWILMDATFGFQKAETYGIAMAMAPNYSLEHARRFGPILESISFPRVDTLQYNSGVIFFARRPGVWKVFADWQKLCRAFGPVSDGGDQPFLTLAMEQNSFNPYTLSRAYNYRNFGEHISGMIRIWHSHQSPPPNLNVFDPSAPPRAFRLAPPFERP